MANKISHRRSQGKTISASGNKVSYFSKIKKKIKENALFRFINKEEDEDNDQTFWPFTSKGRLSLSRLN